LITLGGPVRLDADEIGPRLRQVVFEPQGQMLQAQAGAAVEVPDLAEAVFTGTTQVPVVDRSGGTARLTASSRTTRRRPTRTESRRRASVPPSTHSMRGAGPEEADHSPESERKRAARGLSPDPDFFSDSRLRCRSFPAVQGRALAGPAASPGPDTADFPIRVRTRPMILKLTPSSPRDGSPRATTAIGGKVQAGSDIGAPPPDTGVSPAYRPPAAPP